MAVLLVGVVGKRDPRQSRGQHGTAPRTCENDQASLPGRNQSIMLPQTTGRKA